jgi:hypothetical protein
LGVPATPGFEDVVTKRLILLGLGSESAHQRARVVFER